MHCINEKEKQCEPLQRLLWFSCPSLPKTYCYHILIEFEVLFAFCELYFVRQGNSTGAIGSY